MLRPRWKKVISDLWISKSRTALVVVSIFIGVFATGVISGARTIVSEELARSYERINPAQISIRFQSEDSFDDDLLNVVRGVDGVEAVEGRRSTTVSIETEPDNWEDLRLTHIPDLDDIEINQLALVAGVADLGDKEVLLERSSMQSLHASVGDKIRIELTDGEWKGLEIVGVVHDLTRPPTSMTGTYDGYVTADTMEWLGEPRDFSEMLIRIEEPTLAQLASLPASSSTPDARQPGSGAESGGGGGGGGGGGMAAGRETPETRYMTQVMENINQKIQKSGREVQPPRGPHGGISTEHWATGFIENLSMMMNVLGIMSLLLSGFLVTNTISALLAQQVRQIGIMKAIGARTLQMMGMYMVLVFCFGLLAMMLAVPATLAVTDVFVSAIANYFNFDLSGASFPMNIIAMQAFASMVIPVIASFWPVLSGTRITVLHALNSEGIQTSFKKRKDRPGLLSRMVSSVNAAIGRILKRPLMMAVRNTFRRKTRVSLTLITLAVGGLIFTGIFTIRDSLVQTLYDFIEREFQFDLVVALDRSYPDYEAIDTIKEVPGIGVVEAWGSANASRIYPNGWESEDISLSALPPESELLQPTIIKGRWLLPADENALVVTTGVLDDDPDITVGSEIMLNLNDEYSRWVVVGIATGMGDSREGYVTYDYFNRKIGNVGKASVLRVRFTPTNDVPPATMIEMIETHLERNSIGVGRVFSMSEMLNMVMQRFNFIVIALLVMALLIAVVGGLGLAGTMSLNVIERTREIGIMRSIGASDGMILQIFLGEGLVIGMISWLLGTALALPVSKFLSDAMGNLFFRMPLSFSFSLEGMLGWLGLSLVLAVLASFLPSWNATRLSVRNALAYE